MNTTFNAHFSLYPADYDFSITKPFGEKSDATHELIIITSETDPYKASLLVRQIAEEYAKQHNILTLGNSLTRDKITFHEEHTIKETIYI